MKKQAIITLLLALVAMAGQAKEKTIIWEKPAKALNCADLLEIEKVELTKQQTRLYASYSNMPGQWFRIAKESCLQSGGKTFRIVSADSITLGEKFTLGDDGSQRFVLRFEPLPMKTKEFDFIEGMGDNDFKVFGIHDSTYTMSAAPVPAEYLADYAEDDQLENMKYGEEPAVVHFKALNYRKGMRPRIMAQYIDLKHPGEPQNLYLRMNDDGEAELKLYVGFPQVVWFHMNNFPWGSNCSLYLAPGKEVTVLVDMLKDDTYKGNKFVGYRGYFAKFAREYYQMQTQDDNIKMKETARTVEELIRDYDEYSAKNDKYIENLPCEQAVKDWLTQLIYSGSYSFSYYGNPIDSLSKQPAFAEHLLQHHISGLRDRKAILTFAFTEGSRYYAMDKEARGINADLARYCYYLPKVLDGQKVGKPLIEDANLSALYDEAVREYQKTVAAQKEGLPADVHYLDMTDIAPEDILPAILSKYKGKAVLIDVWATWCGPCRMGHKLMAPLKEELKGKDIEFVYITSPSSPYEDWKNMIGDIPGNHYYLTKEQYNHLLDLYHSNGIPTYAIYDASGKQTYTEIGFPGVETIKEEIEKALSTK
ncbi:MAG: TlpA family protein disulfide reductase [Bacteroidaceae bacterium]|nr:TlpA family protein disulfide reductase [Bacteroidaceae bacterium]